MGEVAPTSRIGELFCSQGARYRVECVAFAPDGCHALTGGADKTVRLWRLPAGGGSG